MQVRYFTVTRSNATPDFITGKWKVTYPSEFIINPILPKRIELINFIYFNEKGQLDIGTSCHSSFNMDAIENDQMMGFCCYSNSTTKSFEIRTNNTTFDLWFKDYKGNTIFPVSTNEYFLLELNLIF